jgi:hypothetical protein
MNISEKKDIMKGFMKEAVLRWGKEEANLLREDIKETAEAVWKIQNVKIETGEEAWLRRGRD